jgi:hypothetical protein
MRGVFERHVELTGRRCKCGKGILRWYTFGQRPPNGYFIEACVDGCDPREPDGAGIDGVLWRARQRRALSEACYSDARGIK